MECNKDLFTDNIVHFVRNKREMIRSWELQLFPQNLLQVEHVPNLNSFQLSNEQISVLERVKAMVNARNDHYRTVACLQPDITNTNASIWTKFLLIHGPPGTGKSHGIRE